MKLQARLPVMLAALLAGLAAVSAADETPVDDGMVDESAQEPAMDADDARAKEALCSYVVGETEFRVFQDDFAGYFTRANASNPNAGPGILLRPLKWKKNIDAPPEKGHLLAAMFGKEKIPDELTPYVSGAYALGHPKPDSTASYYDQDPDSFNALAVLLFQEGVLTQLEAPLCDD